MEPTAPAPKRRRSTIFRAAQILADALAPEGALPAWARNPHGPGRQGQLSARPLVLSEATRVRGGRKSRRRTARVWVAA